MVKLDTLLKIAQAHGLKNDDGTPITTEKRKLNIDMDKLCPEARADVYRHIAIAEDEARRRLEDQLEALGLLPLYRVYRGEDGKKNVRVYREKKE